jgi:hypothetical protein
MCTFDVSLVAHFIRLICIHVTTMMLKIASQPPATSHALRSPAGGCRPLMICMLLAAQLPTIQQAQPKASPLRSFTPPYSSAAVPNKYQHKFQQSNNIRYTWMQEFTLGWLLPISNPIDLALTKPTLIIILKLVLVFIRVWEV